MEERNQSTSSKFKETLAVIFMVIVAGVIGSVLTTCTAPTPNPLPGALVKEAQVNPTVKHEEKVDVPLSTVRAFKPEAKASLPLPGEVAEDPEQHAIASIRLSPSESRQIITTTVDTRTGETSSYVSPAGDPWFALENRGSLGLDIGYKPLPGGGGHAPVARINLRQDFLQTKSIHWGVSGSLYSDGDYFVGLGGQLRW